MADHDGDAVDPAALEPLLRRARTLGFLGPGPVRSHLDQSQSFVVALDAIEGRVVDLGSGAGVPGLVVALARPSLEIILIDAMTRRVAFLREAVRELAVHDRVQVVRGRAEEVGRGALRGSAAAVLARGFGPPAVTAECAAPLLATGGVLVVSEPPSSSGDRWPPAGLTALGLRPGQRLGNHPVVQVLQQVAPCPDTYPRRVGVPAKRPLF